MASAPSRPRAGGLRAPARPDVRRAAIQQLRDRRARELALGDEAAGPAAADERAEVRRVAARDEDDGGRAVEGRDALGHGEPVEVGQVDVEQHDVRAEAAGLVDAALAVRGLADHVVALRLQEHARRRPEGRVVVDDEDGRGHLG
jgi:hypothetical protein